MYFKGLGYYPVKLDKGRYNIDIKYKTNACVKYRPDTDWQNISVNLINLKN